MSRYILVAGFTLALLGCAENTAEMSAENSGMDLEPAMPPVDVIRTRGEGTVVGSDAGMRFLTLDHDAIPAIQMGAMTMPFDIADGVDMAALEEGDRVVFDLEASEETGLLITRLCRPASDGEDCLDD